MAMKVCSLEDMVKVFEDVSEMTEGIEVDLDSGTTEDDSGLERDGEKKK